MNQFTPVAAESVKPVAPAYRIHAGARKLDGKSALGKSGSCTLLALQQRLTNSKKLDPFFVISRVISNGTRAKLYRSEHVKDNLNPDWKPFDVNLSDMGGMDSDIVVDVYDWYVNFLF